MYIYYLCILAWTEMCTYILNNQSQGIKYEFHPLLFLFYDL